MTKEEFQLKVKEVSVILESIVNDDGVWINTSLYGFLSTAYFAVGLAITRVNDEYVSSDLVEVTLSHD